MRPHRRSSKSSLKKDTHSQSHNHSKEPTQHQHHHHSKTSRITSCSKTKKKIKSKGHPHHVPSEKAQLTEHTTTKPTDRRHLNLAITVERPSSPPTSTKDGNHGCCKDIVVVVEPPQLPAPTSSTLSSAKSSPGQRRTSSPVPSPESTSSSRSASSTSLGSSPSPTASASSSSSSSFCRHCLRPQRELQLRYVRHRRHKKPEPNQELPLASHNPRQLATTQPTALSEPVQGRRTSKRSAATPSSTGTAMKSGGSQRIHRTATGTRTSSTITTATTANQRQRHSHRYSQPTTMTTIRIESEGGGAASMSRNQNLNQNLSVTTPNLLTVSGASSNRSSRSGRASSSRSGQPDQQTPESPSLVKVRTWYTVAKQGVSC